MGMLLATADEFLRRRGPFDPAAPAAPGFQLKWLLLLVGLSGAIYGAVLGEFSVAVHPVQILVAALKVPVLLAGTFLLCLPSFFIFNLVAGVAEDFPRALQAVIRGQTASGIVLASLAPLTLLMNHTTANYTFIVFWNGVVFAAATFLGYAQLHHLYRGLIRRRRVHAVLQLAWIVSIVFVGIQMAWVLRPFVGNPWTPLELFRQDAWGNAYVAVGVLVAGVFRDIGAEMLELLAR